MKKQTISIPEKSKSSLQTTRNPQLDNPKRFQWIENTAAFLIKDCQEKTQLSEKAVNYAIQYGVITIGEAATQVKNSFQGGAVPKRHRAMPWDNLIKLRQLASHHFHQMDQTVLVNAVKQDMIHIKLIANNLLQKNEAAQLEPDLTILQSLLHHYDQCKKEAKEKRKKQKTQREPEKITRQQAKAIKYLNKILEELGNIEEFFEAGCHLDKSSNARCG